MDLASAQGQTLSRLPALSPGVHEDSRGCAPRVGIEERGRANVWGFDAKRLGSGLGSTPLDIVVLFADSPRGPAVSPDGTTVYAAAFHSGSQTTAWSSRSRTTLDDTSTESNSRST